jgi:hypothetical protein
MAGPVACVIRVQGALDAGWSDRLGGLRLTTAGAGTWGATELCGELPDQAALLGVLIHLYDLGVPLLAVDTAPVPHPADG